MPHAGLSTKNNFHPSLERHVTSQRCHAETRKHCNVGTQQQQLSDIHSYTIERLLCDHCIPRWSDTCSQKHRDIVTSKPQTTQPRHSLPQHRPRATYHRIRSSNVATTSPQRRHNVATTSPQRRNERTERRNERTSQRRNVATSQRQRTNAKHQQTRIRRLQPASQNLFSLCRTSPPKTCTVYLHSTNSLNITEPYRRDNNF